MLAEPQKFVKFREILSWVGELAQIVVCCLLSVIIIVTFALLSVSTFRSSITVRNRPNSSKRPETPVFSPDFDIGLSVL